MPASYHVLRYWTFFTECMQHVQINQYIIKYKTKMAKPLRQQLPQMIRPKQLNKLVTLRYPKAWLSWTTLSVSNIKSKTHMANAAISLDKTFHLSETAPWLIHKLYRFCTRSAWRQRDRVYVARRKRLVSCTRNVSFCRTFLQIRENVVEFYKFFQHSH